MLQEKLSALSIKCIKSDNLHSLSFQDIINDFALKNNKRESFNI
jgi:hypothetical protein